MSDLGTVGAVIGGLGLDEPVHHAAASAADARGGVMAGTEAESLALGSLLSMGGMEDAAVLAGQGSMGLPSQPQQAAAVSSDAAQRVGLPGLASSSADAGRSAMGQGGLDALGLGLGHAQGEAGSAAESGAAELGLGSIVGDAGLGGGFGGLSGLQ